MLQIEQKMNLTYNQKTVTDNAIKQRQLNVKTIKGNARVNYDSIYECALSLRIKFNNSILSAHFATKADDSLHPVNGLAIDF